MARKNPKRKQNHGSGQDLENVKKNLEKMDYGLVGKHSAVKICHWTKSAIRGDSPCWKEKFYGISSAGCAEITPAMLWCEHNCVHCWRPMELYQGSDIKKDTGEHLDSPREIIEGIIDKRKELLQGFRGRKGVDLEKFEDILEPKLYSLSLSGEPTLYPRIGELFREIRSRGAVSFLVTNGLNPETLRGLKESDLPTQLVLSTNAPNEELYKIWHRSRDKEAWKKFNESIKILKELNGKTRTVIRLTLVSTEGLEGNVSHLTNMSEENIKEYARMILRAEPNFVHIKGYKSIGYARDRLGYDKQPWHEEVKDYSKKILKELKRLDPENKFGYEIKGEDETSVVIMFARKDSKLKITRV